MGKRSIKVDEFEYYNPNPTGSDKSADCVVRAFCKALNKNWDEVYKDLCDIGFELKDMPNSKQVIIEYYKRNGFVKTKVSTKKGTKRGTVKEFCKKNPIGTFILDVAQHVVCIQDGIFYDLGVWSGRSALYGIWRKGE